jgi:hypothetical protein
MRKLPQLTLYPIKQIKITLISKLNDFHAKFLQSNSSTQIDLQTPLDYIQFLGELHVL